MIDGGKALRKAIVECFGAPGAHPALPGAQAAQRDRAPARGAARQRRPRHARCLGRRQRRRWPGKQLQRLAASLQAKHPGAAASLREGLEETLTVQALGITGALYRTLRTTNPIENLNGSIAHFTRNVKRWKDGQMTLRWVAGALSDAKGRFRKLRGHRDMKLCWPHWQPRPPNRNAPNARPRSITNEEPSPARVQQRTGHRLFMVVTNVCRHAPPLRSGPPAQQRKPIHGAPPTAAV